MHSNIQSICLSDKMNELTNYREIETRQRKGESKERKERKVILQFAPNHGFL